ncbi:MAG: type VI secretion system tube protein Hcp [Rubrivivax sp.]|nr:type VI secretion system tube protein Hcp [Rubrivivax sp.]
MPSTFAVCPPWAAAAMRRFAPLIAATAAATATFGAAAADQIFLKLDGIRGTATDRNHRDEIEVTSYAQSFRNTVNFGFGSGGASSGRVRCGDVTLLKNIDNATPDLIMHVTTGRHIPEGVITFQRSGAQTFDYYIVRLRDVVVDAVEQIDPPGDGTLTEKISLKARQFQFTYVPVDARGAAGTPVSFGWDCVSNTRF